MIIFIATTIAIAIVLMLCGLAQLDNDRAVITDCATPGHVNDDYKGIRYVK